MQLSADFKFLKEATPRNFENLQQALNLQQSYTADLCGHINLIYSKLVKIEVHIQKCYISPVPNLDDVQLDTLEYDPDIDEPLIQNEQPTKHCVVISVQDIPSPPKSNAVDAPGTEEDTTGRDQQDDSAFLVETTHQSLHLPQQNQDQQELDIYAPFETNSEPDQREQAEIPELVEDWNGDQFADVEGDWIDHHNMQDKSSHIREDYSQHLLNFSDNDYYSHELPEVLNGFSVSIPKRSTRFN